MMIYKCPYCPKTLASKSSFNNHVLKARYCIANRKEKSDFLTYSCEFCLKEFTSKQSRIFHELKCPEGIDNRHKNEISILTSDLERVRKDYKELLESYQRLAELYVLDGKNKVEHLNKKFLKRRGRTRFEGQNVIYVLTTPSLKKERRYILGKATNLTNRLSTYNKTDEHEVVFYSSCPDKEKMSLVEGLVFDKLKDCREQANRERFILPEDRKIDFFSETIKKCIEFVK